MISAIGTPAVSNPIPVPITAPSGGVLSCTPTGAVTKCPPEADELSLSEPGSLTSSDGTYRRTSLNIRARSEVKTTDDGDVLALSQAKLRFRYDFKAADGTSIHIRVQANLNYSQTTDSEDGSQTTKLRAMMRVSMLQEHVSSGIAPLQETPDISAEAKEFISQAIDLFQQIVDATTSAFLDSDPLDGDSLIAGLVEAFNELSAAIDSMFVSPPADSETASPGEVVALLENAATNPSEVFAAAPTQTEEYPPIDVESASPSVVPPPSIVPSNGPETELLDVVGLGEPSALTNDILPVASEQEAASEGQEVAPATNEPSESFVGSVMTRVRLQMIESLRSLVDAFDSDSSGRQVSRSVFGASAQISARYSFRASDANDSLSNARGIDAQV
jgi:hypothetical protein